MVEAFFDLIRDAWSTGEDVKLSGFGNFQIRAQGAAARAATRAPARRSRSRRAAS